MLPWTPIETAHVVASLSHPQWTTDTPCPEWVARIEYRCCVAACITKSLAEWGTRWGVSKSTAHRWIAGDDKRFILGFANEDLTLKTAGRAHPTAWLGDVEGKSWGRGNADEQRVSDVSRGNLRDASRARFLIEDEDKESFVFSSDDETTESQQALLSNPEPAATSLPKWCPRKGIDGTPPQDVYRVVIKTLEAIKGSINPDRCATAAKQLIKGWSAFGEDYDTFIDYCEDVQDLAEWAQKSPDRMAAYDIRAEGWADGQDRSRSIGTLLRREKWADRIDLAGRWHDAGKPTQAPLRGPESISSGQGGYDPVSTVSGLVRACGASWLDKAWPMLGEQIKAGDINARATARALARLGGATDVSALTNPEQVRFAGVGYATWRAANDWKISKELAPQLRQYFIDEMRRIEG